MPGFSRRSFIKGSAILAAVGLVSHWAKRLWVPGAVADTGQVVRTEDLRLGAGEMAGGSLNGTQIADSRLSLAASGSGEYISPKLRSSFPATHVGLHWRGSAPQAVSFWLRSSPDDTAWSQWQPVIVEVGHGRETLPETFGALIRVNGANYFQFRTRLEGGRGDAEIESVTLTALNTEDGPLVSSLDAVTSAIPSTKPLTFSREDWGANEALRFDGSGEIWPRGYVPTKKVVVHHTVTGDYSSPSEAQADVRAIYTYHAQTLGWGDIGYNWLIDKFGNAYEGRRGRDGPGYDGPGGRELVSEGVVAGHARSYNHGSSGVAMLGTFTSVPPSSEALSKLTDVLAWECSRHGINPQTSSDFLKANDSWHRGLPNVCGHRDTIATACPGNSLYALLPGLRNDITSRLAGSSDSSVSITSAPPQGTRTDRNVSYAWQGSGAIDYSHYLEGWSLDNVGVVYWSGLNAAHEPAWSPWTTATQAAFTLLQPGHYTFHVRARDSQGRVSAYYDLRTLLADVTPVAIAMSLDAPAEGSTVRQPFLVAGWAIDQAVTSGTGVDAVHVYAYPTDASGTPTGAAPAFLGAASLGESRGDVAAVFGEQFTNSGYALSATGLGGGFYRLVVYARSATTGMWSAATRQIQVPSADTVMDTPSRGSTVRRPFLVAGWAVDRAAASGTGVDAVHVYAYPADASGTPT
ncbi:MAG: N-acetylmuramoyl-L-alanine amidase, partial [Chloroflexi bacterium]|nr:N-acetylmuramoyl-L-alanine amidase [Chloroflexota bacterium]